MVIGRAIASLAPAPLTLARVDSLLLLSWCSDIVSLVFAFAFGACVGSLTNVLVYRLPRGIGVITPPSACPSCGTRLTWRENIPVVGWLLLRGRCRFCSIRISPEYPIVEAIVGVVFALFFFLWYIVPRSAGALGIDWGAVRPEYAMLGFQQTWPAFVLLLVLVASLIAMTIVDAKTFTIPLVLAWVPAGAAVVVHPLYALWCSRSGNAVQTQPGWAWIIASPDPTGWRLIGGSVGGVLGVGIANLLLHFGLIRRSFADYEEWEAKEIERQRAESGVPEGEAPAADPADVPVDLWVQYPHARREALKEIVFLAPVIGLGYAGALLAYWLAGPWTTSTVFPFDQAPAHVAPLWLVALSAVLMGYLIGGGVVWAVRILGAMLFGKDAMGLGDVHLLGAVGACLGWIDAVNAFFLAAFVGLFWAVVGMISGGRAKRVLPFGPYLAIGALLALLAKPALWALFSRVAKTPVAWP